MTNTIIIKGKKLTIASMIYIFSPIVLWINTWSRMLFSIPATILIILSVLMSMRTAEHDFAISFNIHQFVGMIVIILVVGITAGWGGLTPQASDWHKHNAVLRDLINKQWPVYYYNHGTLSFLTYYLGQYMVPAAAAKMIRLLFPVTNETVFILGEISMLAWNCIGLFLVFLYVLHLSNNRKKHVLVCVCFIAFGSLLPIGKCALGLIYEHKLTSFLDLINQDILGYHNLDLKHIKAQYTTNFVQLRWVFQQAIVTWLIMSIFLEGVFSFNSYVVLALPLLCYAAFPFLGLLPFLLVDALRDLCRHSTEFKKWLKKCFSLQNLMMLCSLGSFMFLYLCGQSFSVNKPGFLKLHTNSFTIPALLVFWLSSFGIYAVLLIPAVRKHRIMDRTFFVTSVLVLLILPLYRMGAANDFTMRVSIPALFVLSIAFLRTIFSETIRGKKVYFALLVVALAIGSFFPIVEFETVLISNDIYNHQEIADNFGSLEYYANPNLETVDPIRYILNGRHDDICYNYYTFGENMNAFVNSIARSKPTKMPDSERTGEVMKTQKTG